MRYACSLGARCIAAMTALVVANIPAALRSLADGLIHLGGSNAAMV